MKNMNFNLNKKTKTVLKNGVICFILWFLSYWALSACHNAESASVLEFFWGATGIGLFVSVIFVIVGTIVSLSEKD